MVCGVETVAPEDSAVEEASCTGECGRRGVSLVTRAARGAQHGREESEDM